MRGMATGGDHRAAAVSVGHAIDALVAVRAGLDADRSDIGIRGGPVAGLVDRAIGVSLTNLDHLHRRCSALIDELHRRAALCDQYTIDLRRYHDAHRSWANAVDRYHSARAEHRRARWPGDEPVPPAPPFAGAEAG
jgi:hypothetical protein